MPSNATTRLAWPWLVLLVVLSTLLPVNGRADPADTEGGDSLDVFDSDVEHTRQGWSELYVALGGTLFDADGSFSVAPPNRDPITIIDFDRGGPGYNAHGARQRWRIRAGSGHGRPEDTRPLAQHHGLCLLETSPAVDRNCPAGLVRPGLRRIQRQNAEHSRDGKLRSVLALVVGTGLPARRPRTGHRGRMTTGGLRHRIQRTHTLRQVQVLK